MHLPNLLVVTAGVQNTLLRWKEGGVIQESAWHRLAQFEVLLQRLTAADALAIVRSRLREFLAPWAGLEPLRRRLAEDDLFPLGRPWYDRFLRDKIEVRPRDAINWAREGWRQQQEAANFVEAQCGSGQCRWHLHMYDPVFGQHQDHSAQTLAAVDAADSAFERLCLRHAGRVGGIRRVRPAVGALSSLDVRSSSARRTRRLLGRSDQIQVLG